MKVTTETQLSPPPLDFVAGSVRLAVLPNATGVVLGEFIRSHVKAGSKVATDGFSSYRNQLTEFQHDPAVAAGIHLPIVRTLFSNMKTWLIGTHHGVSTKHLPRYLREWSYRFNRRGMVGTLEHFMLRRVVNKMTISYADLVGGVKAQEA